VKAKFTKAKFIIFQEIFESNWYLEKAINIYFHYEHPRIASNLLGKLNSLDFTWQWH